MDELRFRLAALQINVLCDMHTVYDVRQSLKILPDALKSTYDDIYKRILTQKGDAPSLALNAFRWIQCSSRPLKSKLLLDAITLRISHAEEHSRIGRITANGLLNACQNLLVFDNNLDVFRFAHLSVDEFLETRLPKVDSHAGIARACLLLLCSTSALNEYESASRPGRDYEDLLVYATLRWPWHLSFGSDANSFQISASLWTEFASKTYDRWANNYVRHRKWQEGPHVWLSSELGPENEDPLGCASHFGLSRMFEVLFESRSPLETAFLDRLLLLASQSGALKIARFLLDRGANLSVRGLRFNRTALHLASERGHETTVQMLLDNAADISDIDSKGKTALIIASEQGNERTARRLLDAGGDISARDLTGRTALIAMFASRNHDPAVAQLLLDRGADFSVTDNNGQTALMLASVNGNPASVQLLIDRGADVSASDHSGMTPLILAIKHHSQTKEKHLSIVRLLIDAGANVLATDYCGQTPFIIAVNEKRDALVNLIVNKRPDFSSTDRYERTPLMIVSQRGDEAMVRLLLDRGADPSDSGSYGKTPLILATEGGHEAVVRLLIDKGMDHSAVGWGGRHY